MEGVQAGVAWQLFHPIILIPTNQPRDLSTTRGRHAQSSRTASVALQPLRSFGAEKNLWRSEEKTLLNPLTYHADGG